MKSRVRIAIMILFFIFGSSIILYFNWQLMVGIFLLLLGCYNLGALQMENEKRKKYNGKL